MSLPIDIDDDLSSYLLGTKRSPGVVTFSGHDREKGWDVKQAKGQTGASTSRIGDPIGQFEASHYLAGDGGDGDVVSDFDLWEDFQRLLESMVDGPTPVALPIFHPDLARNHYTEVTVAKIGGMVHDGKGGATVKVKYSEYKPPKAKPVSKAQPKPGGSQATAGGTTRPDPNAAAKKELAGLLEEAKKP